MSLCEFVTSTGKKYNYDNQTNTVYCNDVPVVFSNDCYSSDFIEEIVATSKKYNRSHKKIHSPAVIRLSLGQACNYDCTYCNQKDIGNPEERPVRKGAIDLFKDNVSEFLDLSNLSCVELWGGEPLLYWNDIKDVCTFFDNDNISFLMFTNGSLLKQKHVDFFKGLKASVRIVISHDALFQEKHRGEDIFNNEDVCNTIKQLDSMHPKILLQTNTVITNKNINPFQINDYFKNIFNKLKLSNTIIGFELGRAYEVKDWNESLVLQGNDLEILKKNFNEFYKKHTEQLLGIDHGLLKTDIFDHDGYHFGVGNIAKSIAIGDPLLQSTTCGADNTDVLSMDIFGNIKLCPHTGSDYNYGTVSNIKGVRIISLDTNRHETHCKDCHNLRICKSSCPITLAKEIFYKNCAVEKIWYGEQLKAALRLLLNEEVSFTN